MRKSLGLTLIELLITIAIVAVISAIGYATYDNGQKKARDSKRKNDLRDIQNALQLYYQDNDYYPDSTTGGDLNSKSKDSWPILGSLLENGYIKIMPKDPRDGGNFFYRYDALGSDKHQSYTLSTDLENNSDPQRADDCNSKQPSSPKHDYCATNP